MSIPMDIDEPSQTVAMTLERQQTSSTAVTSATGPRASLESLPPKILIRVVEALALGRQYTPLTKSHHLERTRYFSCLPPGSRHDIWNLARTCRALRDAAMGRRFGLLRKPIWQDTEKTWPKEMRHALPYVKILDFYDPCKMLPRVFFDYQKTLLDLLPHMSRLLVLRVPTLPPLAAIQSTRLLYLEAMLLPTAVYKPSVVRPRGSAIKVDIFVLTELDDDTLSIADRSALDLRSMLWHGQANQPWKMALDAVLEGMRDVDQLLVRTGGICLPLGGGQPGRVQPFKALMGKSALAKTKRLSLEVRADFQGETAAQYQAAVLSHLGPYLKDHINPDLEHVTLHWNCLTSMGPADLKRWIERFTEEDGYDDMALEDLTSLQLDCTPLGGSQQAAYTAWAQTLKKLKQLHMVNWIAARYINPEHKTALSRCPKAFLRRTVTVERAPLLKVVETEGLSSFGWAEALLDQITASMSELERHYFEHFHGEDANGMDYDACPEGCRYLEAEMGARLEEYEELEQFDMYRHIRSRCAYYSDGDDYDF